MKKIIFFRCFVFFLCFGITACNSDCLTQHLFEVPHKVYSRHDTLSIGDTLWVEAEFSDYLYDKMLKKNYTVGPDLLAVTAKIVSCDTTTSVSSSIGTAFFDTYNSIGNVRKENNSFQLDYVYQNGSYKLKSGFIPLKKGIFALYFDYNQSKMSAVNFDNKCGKERASVDFNTNQSASNGYDLYKKSIRGKGQPGYPGGGMFAFKVK
jgi:hypothetical protein